jgi:two-component system, LytTR family, sensor kinase
MLFAGWWLSWTVLQAIFLYWLSQDLVSSVTDSLVTNVLLAAACILVTSHLKYYRPREERYGYILLLCLALTILWLALTKTIVVFIIGSNDYQQFFNKTLPVRVGTGFLLIVCMAMISLVWYGMEDQKENEKRKQEAEKLSREAELYKLRQQLQPHFLFNSLNSINALITAQPEKARTMIQELSDFLRATIKKEEQSSISLEEEIQYLELYLSIEKKRFGHRLSADISVDENSRQLRIPNMLLQPLVENAIKFGLYDTTGDIVIRIQTELADQFLLLQVKNPYDPETYGGRQGTGFGLSSVKRRLNLLYGRDDLLETLMHDSCFTATIKIPQQSKILPENQVL